MAPLPELPDYASKLDAFARTQERVSRNVRLSVEFSLFYEAIWGSSVYQSRSIPSRGIRKNVAPHLETHSGVSGTQNIPKLLPNSGFSKIQQWCTRCCALTLSESVKGHNGRVLAEYHERAPRLGRPKLQFQSSLNFIIRVWSQLVRSFGASMPCAGLALV